MRFITAVNIKVTVLVVGRRVVRQINTNVLAGPAETFMSPEDAGTLSDEEKLVRFTTRV